MNTYVDIIRKELRAVDSASCILMDTGYYMNLTAWVHPGGLYALFLDESLLREADPDHTASIQRAHWIEEHWSAAQYVEVSKSKTLLLGGWRRKLWFNESDNAGDRRNYPMANTLYSRLKCHGCILYQSTIKPYEYFLVTENIRPYAMIMPVRLAPTKEEGV